jgi:hypothetical protein
MGIPTLPVWNGGSVTDQQLNLINTALAYCLYPPAVKITRTGAAQTIATSTSTAVQFDTVAVTNPASSGMVNLGTNNTRITIVDPGFYVICASAGWAINTAGVRSYTIRKNGSTQTTQVGVPTVSGVGNAPFMSLVTLDTFTAGDYVEFILSQDSGGNLTTATSMLPFMAAARVSGTP